MATPPAPRSQVRIVLIEDHVLFAESLELALSIEGYDVLRMPVPERTSSSSALLTAIVRARPRIVLLDLDLGDFGDGTRLIAPLTRQGIQVLVVTGSPDHSRWGDALRHGARKVTSKSRPLNEILTTVRRLNHGRSVLDREERDDLLREWHERRSERLEDSLRLDLLSPRERQVLAHLMRGRTVHDIAVRGVVSEGTVRTQVKAILSKLEVSSQLAAVGLAHHVEWHPPEV